ncbi:cytohesin-like protein [Cryptosporidium ubiquitum]|uniref:Cytohesin-like protein n=1 Tax=Cryptosporidium ubiquitum TaxID=857276 RepID=A0A1J4MG24_9CRYT|nr:cytohesin-like protein [Cryptosporidium ubiquitum]OII73210.1 cytohesin-like protein [Cryptosporidium ubiquitum]
MNSFTSASSSISSISRNSQILPNYFFQSGSLSEGLGNIPVDHDEESKVTIPGQSIKSFNSSQLSNDHIRYSPVHSLTGAPIYNSISMGSDEYKEMLRMSNELRKSQEFERIQGRAPPEMYKSPKNSCILSKCDIPEVLGDCYKVEKTNTLADRKQLNAPIYVKEEKVLNSISKNVVNNIPYSQVYNSNNNANQPSDQLKSLFSIKSSEIKEPSNKVKENALIQEFKNNNVSIPKKPFINNEFSPITCMNNTCSNIKGAINILGVTGKIFMDVLFHLVNAFDLDTKETSNNSNNKFENMPHFPVSSIGIPPDTVILQCFDCGLIYYTDLPLNKQQLGTIGILDPKPIEFGQPDSEEIIYGISNRNSPYYCWGNLEPRDLSPNQIEFLKKIDLRKQNRFSHQDLVDLYYYRFRKDRRYEENFPIYVQSDPQLHLYKFYRETMHGAYNGNKTPLPDLGNHFLPSPWNGNRTNNKLNKSSSSSSSNSNKSTETKNNFEKDQDGFIILPKFDPPSENLSEYDLANMPDKSHIFPFILDSF